MAGWWRRLFGGGDDVDEWERIEEPPAVAEEYEFEHESVDTRQAEDFAEEHLGGIAPDRFIDDGEPEHH
jgi:hypothetical protein